MAKKSTSGSAGELLMATQLDAERIEYEREVMLAPPRRWRVDFFLPRINAAVEIEGGTWNGGRHVQGAGFEKDCEKYNRLTELGFQVLRYTTSMVKRGEAVAQIKSMVME
tara:strand:+ start:896 stop:1225 length:330 start_codon:yes stop_codon:yes gene_type:complete